MNAIQDRIQLARYCKAQAGSNKSIQVVCYRSHIDIIRQIALCHIL